MARIDENFNRADGGVGSNWTDTGYGSGGLQIVSNAVRSGTSGYRESSYTGASVSTANYSVLVEYRSGGDAFLVWARGTGTGATKSGYHANFFGSGGITTCNLSVTTNDSDTGLIADTALPATLVAGDVVGIRVNGSTISILCNGAVVASVTDATYSAAGAARLGIYDSNNAAGPLLDNFIWIDRDNITGTAALVATGTGTLTGKGALSGIAVLVATCTSTLKGAGALSGTAPLVVGSGSTSLKGSGKLQGTAPLVMGSGSTSLKGGGALSGTAALVIGSASTLLKGVGALIGAAALVFGGSGSLTNANAGGVSGTAPLVIVATSTLSGFGALSGTAPSVFTATGTLSGSGVLSGTAPNAFTGSSTLAGKGALSGTALSAFTGAGTFSGSGALSGTAPNAFTGTGTLQGFGALSGTAPNTFTGAGTFSGSGVLSGTAPNAFTGTGTLTGKGALAGTAANAFTGTGTFSGSGALSGTAPNAFTGTGTLTGGVTQLVLVTDPFNRADGGVGASWADTGYSSGGLQIVGNAIRAGASGYRESAYVGAVTPSANYSVLVEYRSGGGAFLVWARATGADATKSGYHANFFGGASTITTCNLIVTTNDSDTTIIADTALPVTLVAGDVVGIQVNGSTISITRNGVVVASVTDTTYSAKGNARLGIYDPDNSTGPLLDNFNWVDRDNLSGAAALTFSPVAYFGYLSGSAALTVGGSSTLTGKGALSGTAPLVITATGGFVNAGLIRTNLDSKIADIGSGVVPITSNSFTPPNNSLLVVIGDMLEYQGNSDPSTALTITDSVGLTWTRRVTSGDNNFYTMGSAIWTAPVATGVAMTVTIGSGGRSVASWLMAVMAYTGYNVASPTGVTASAALATSGADALTLSGVPASTSQIIGVASAKQDFTRNSTGKPASGSGFTEQYALVRDAGTGAITMEVQTRGGSTSTNVPWSTVNDDPDSGENFNFNTNAMALEIKAANTTPGSTYGTASASFNAAGLLTGAGTYYSSKVNPSLGTYLIGNPREEYNTSGYKSYMGLMRTVITSAKPGIEGLGFTFKSVLDGIAAASPLPEQCIANYHDHFFVANYAESSYLDAMTAGNWFLRGAYPSGSLYYNSPYYIGNITAGGNTVSGRDYNKFAVDWHLDFARYGGAQSLTGYSATATNLSAVFLDDVQTANNVGQDFPRLGYSNGGGSAAIRAGNLDIRDKYKAAGMTRVLANLSQMARIENAGSIGDYAGAFDGGACESQLGAYSDDINQNFASSLLRYQQQMSCVVAKGGFTVFCHDNVATDGSAPVTLNTAYRPDLGWTNGPAGKGVRGGYAYCAVMGDADYHPSGSSPGAGYDPRDRRWFKFMSVNRVTGVGNDLASAAADMGYLGRWIDPPQTTAQPNGTYRRRAEYGEVWLNPRGNGTQTITFGRTVRFPSCSDDSTIYDGSSRTSRSIAENDGYIVLYAPALNGSAAMATTGAGTLRGAGALAGSSSGGFSATGVLTGTGILAGTSTLTVASSAALNSLGGLLGAASILFGASLTLSGASPAMIGRAYLTFSGASYISGLINRSGTFVINAAYGSGTIYADGQGLFWTIP